MVSDGTFGKWPTPMEAIRQGGHVESGPELSKHGRGLLGSRICCIRGVYAAEPVEPPGERGSHDDYSTGDGAQCSPTDRF